MAKRVLPEVMGFEYNLKYDSSIGFTHAPTQEKYRELALTAINKFNDEVKSINEQYKQAIAIEKDNITAILAGVTFLRSKEIEGVMHYWVERQAALSTDITEAYANTIKDSPALKPVEFIGFKVINNVFITSRAVGGNHIFFNNGELLTDQEIVDLENKYSSNETC